MKCTQRYLSSHYSYSREIQLELIASFPSNIASAHSLKKIIRIAAQILRINLMECAYLSWLLRRSKCSIDKMELIDCSDLEDASSRRLLLYLLLNGYYVKDYLGGVCPKIDSDILHMLADFGDIYAKWRPDDLLKNASLREINNIVEKWTYCPSETTRIDYNSMVNRILDLSKTYNVTNEESEPKKKRKGDANMGVEEKIRGSGSGRGQLIEMYERNNSLGSSVHPPALLNSLHGPSLNESVNLRESNVWGSLSLVRMSTRRFTAMNNSLFHNGFPQEPKEGIMASQSRKIVPPNPLQVGSMRNSMMQRSLFKPTSSFDQYM